MQATSLKAFGSGLKSCKLRMRVQHLGTNNYSIGFLHLQLIHILARSPTVTVNSALVLAKHIQLWNQDSLGYGYGVRVVQTTLPAPFQSTITGVVVLGFRSSSVAVTHDGYLVESRRPFWFGSPQANRRL